MQFPAEALPPGDHKTDELSLSSSQEKKSHESINFTMSLIPPHFVHTHSLDAGKSDAKPDGFDAPKSPVTVLDSSSLAAFQLSHIPMDPIYQLFIFMKR